MDLSDEEKHALELRRERSNKISKIMGDYLLKGYKMLGTNCNRCGTILMRDRQKNDYCVACNDIDGLVNCDQQHMGQSHYQGTQAREPRLAQESLAPNHNEARYSSSGQVSQTDDYRGIIKEAESSILMKMQWASIALRNCSVEESFKLLQLINSCYDTISKLNSSNK
eukprot:gene3504-1888_t